MTYTLEQAQSNLAELLAKAQSGTEVVIERDAQPALLLRVSEVTSTQAQAKRPLGLFRGMAKYDDAAFDPLTDEELVEHGFGFMLEKPLTDQSSN